MYQNDGINSIHGLHNTRIINTTVIVKTLTEPVLRRAESVKISGSRGVKLRLPYESMLTRSRKIVLRFVKSEYHHKQRRTDEQSDAESLAFGVAVAKLHNMDYFGYDRDDNDDGEEDFLRPRRHKFKNVYEYLDHPEDYVENKPDVAHTDKVVRYEYVIKGDEGFPTLFSCLAEDTPFGYGEENIVQK